MHPSTEHKTFTYSKNKNTVDKTGHVVRDIYQQRDIHNMQDYIAVAQWRIYYNHRLLNDSDEIHSELSLMQSSNVRIPFKKYKKENTIIYNSSYALMFYRNVCYLAVMI